MTDDNLLSNLPEGLYKFCNAAVLEDLRNGHIPEFSWYSPRFIPQAGKWKTSHFIDSTFDNTGQQTFTNISNNNNNNRNTHCKSNEENKKQETCEQHRESMTQHDEKVIAHSEGDKFFAPLMHIVLSDNLDGKYDEENGSVMQQVAQRKQALHLDWQKVTPIEEFWNGPPLTTKVPPAKDFENVLLDRECERDDDDDNVDGYDDNLGVVNMLDEDAET